MMQTKILLIFVFSCSTIKLLAQNKLPVSCKILEQTINLEEFERQFFINKTQSDTLMFIDTTNASTNCDIISKYGKKVLIGRINLYHPNKHTGHEPKNLIVLIKFLKKRNYYILDLWRPYNNATLTIRASKKQSKFAIKVIGKGAF